MNQNVPHVYPVSVSGLGLTFEVPNALVWPQETMVCPLDDLVNRGAGLIAIDEEELSDEPLVDLWPFIFEPLWQMACLVVMRA